MAVWQRRYRGNGATSVFEGSKCKVIDLSHVRKSSQKKNQSVSVLYLSEKGTLMKHLALLEGIHTVEVQGAEVLESTLQLFQPDLVILEAGLRWADPFQYIKYFASSFMQTPVIVHFERAHGQSQRIKRAYADGASDTLIGNSCEVELKNTLRLQFLLKRQSVNSAF
jgi:CheY-like chemotaxis protein